MDDLLAAIVADPTDGNLLALYARHVQETFTAWANTLPTRPGWESGTKPLFRAPNRAHGLPNGYVMVAQLHDFQKDTDLFLTRCNGGGAVLVRHEYDLQRSVVFSTAATLCGLYEIMRESIAGSNRVRQHPEAETVTAWLKDVLVAMYDPTDPSEASEQMLFAFSGTLTTPPRAAYCQCLSHATIRP